MAAAARARHELALIHFESSRFRDRLDRAMAALALALRTARRPYVALSGGVDSMATLGLVAAIRDDVTIAWSDDELEYPETVDLMEGLQRVLGEQLVVTLGRSVHAGWFTPWTDRPYWRDPLPGSHRKTMPQDDWMAAPLLAHPSADSAGFWSPRASGTLPVRGAPDRAAMGAASGRSAPR